MPTIPTGVHGDPEVAAVGLASGEIARGWAPADLHRVQVNFADIDRGFTHRNPGEPATEGVLIVKAERLTGRILNATIVGPSATEMIGVFTLAIEQGVSMHALCRLVHPYPAWAGIIGKAADDFARRSLPQLHLEAASFVRGLPRRVRRRLG